MPPSSPRPSLLDRLRGLVKNDALLPLERDMVRRTILSLDASAKGAPDQVLGKSARKTWADGQPIVQEGEREDSLYVLLDGAAEVVRDGRVLETLRPGELFGEISMLTGAPRMATVRAKGEVVALQVPASAVDVAMHVRLWDYAGERRFMSLRGNPVADYQERGRWWCTARVTVLRPGEYDAGAPWVFLFDGVLSLDGQRVEAPALFQGGRVVVEGGEARLALLPDPAELDR